MKKTKHCYPDSFYDTVSTPLGKIYLTYVIKEDRAGSIHIAGLNFDIHGIIPSRKGEKASKLPRGLYLKKSTLIEGIKNQISEYLEGRRKEFDIPIILSGTDFEKKVWLALKEIPYGQTRTYKWLAEKVGSPQGVRAVGQALSRNPLPIILPCHRVIQSDGKPGGYSSGVQIKRRLLDLEYYNSI